MLQLYNDVCQECSRLITHRYSTSFSLGIKCFDKKFHMPIYSIYGFVRFADEIVDTFHFANKKLLLDQFTKDTFDAIASGISLNPVLHAFQQVVNEYNIDHELIEAFLFSMELDLDKSKYDPKLYDKYIYGSAEVVGLMCLRIFVGGDQKEYDRLKFSASRLGAAFQKVNFLRDMKSDFEERGRVYFPGVEYHAFNNLDKDSIEKDIEKDFDDAKVGLMQLPKGAKFGVYVSYTNYRKLFDKIRKTSAEDVLSKRLRISNPRKIYLLCGAAVKNQLNLL